MAKQHRLFLGTGVCQFIFRMELSIRSTPNARKDYTNKGENGGGGVVALTTQHTGRQPEYG